MGRCWGNWAGGQRLVLSMSLVLVVSAALMGQEKPDTFEPLQKWKAALLSGDAAALQAFYSDSPPVAVYANGIKGDRGLEDAFWSNAKVSALQLTMIGSQVRHGLQQEIFSAEITRGDGQRLSVTDQQVWQKQGDDWRIVSVIRTDGPMLQQPSSMSKDIYLAAANAHADLKAAEKRAAEQHKRVLLVFGANWCFDCHVLDLAFQRPDLAALLTSSYEVVHIDLGPDSRKNADLVEQYQIPLDKGVPAVAVAESDGTLVVSQKNGEFENARGMTPEAMLAFLNEWKPARR